MDYKKSKHSFAKIWLNYLGNKIFIGNKRILTLDGMSSYYNKIDFAKYLKPLYPKLKLGVEIVSEEVGKKKNVIEIKYARLRRMGMCIEKIPALGLTGQQVRQSHFYILSKNMANADETPKGKILYDFKHRAVKYKRRFAGNENGVFGKGNETPWKYLYKKKPTLDIKHESSDDMLGYFDDTWTGKQRVFEQEDIILKNEIIGMELDDKRILCVERRKTPFRILACGELGVGKSIMLSGFIDQIHHNFGWKGKPPMKVNDFCILLNDSNNQFYEKMVANQTAIFKQVLRRYNLEPRPSPTINLYIGCPDLTMDFEDEDVSYRLVTSFLRFLKKYDYMTDGITEWRLKGADRYLHHIYDSGREFKTVDSIFEYLSSLNELKAKQLSGMLNKWKSTFVKIYEKEFLDATTGCAAEWKLVRKDGTKINANPIIVAAEAGLMPVVNTTRAKRFDYFKNIQADFTQQLIEYQNNLPEYNRRRFYIAIDEMRTIYEEGMGATAKYSNSKKAVIELFREGRFNNIGFVGNTQNYWTLHKDMQTHCTHLFMGLSKSYNERKLIKKNFDIDEEECSEIANLDTFEFLAICKQDYPFKIYERDGTHSYEHGAYKGKVIPPLSTHLRGE